MVPKTLRLGGRSRLGSVHQNRILPAIPRGSYIPLPEKLQNKNAIINVQNRDNQRLRWALRAALFSPKDGMYHVHAT